MLFSFFQLWSVETIESLLYDFINTCLSGCKMLGLLDCWNADSSVIQVFSAVICDVLLSVGSPAHIPTLRNPSESVLAGTRPSALLLKYLSYWVPWNSVKPFMSLLGWTVIILEILPKVPSSDQTFSFYCCASSLQCVTAPPPSSLQLNTIQINFCPFITCKVKFANCRSMLRHTKLG